MRCFNPSFSLPALLLALSASGLIASCGGESNNDDPAPAADMRVDDKRDMPDDMRVEKDLKVEPDLTQDPDLGVDLGEEMGADADADADTTPRCGDGVLNGTETCDGEDCQAILDDCLSLDACMKSSAVGSAATCDVVCMAEEIEACSLTSDRCCPSACTREEDADCGAPSVGQACQEDGDCGLGERCNNADPTNVPNGYCSRACLSDGECGTGAHCDASGLCRASCQSDGQCRETEGYGCGDVDRDGQLECHPNAPGAAAIGQACELSFDCGGDVYARRCLGNGYNEGYCSALCLDDDECGAGSHCAYKNQGDALGRGFCVASCTPGDMTCRADGYACVNGDDDAANTTECAPSATGVKLTGESCENISECAGGADGTCLQGEWQQGYCSLRCSSDTECGAGAHCGFYEPRDPSSRGVCLLDCTPGDMTCRTDGYLCYDADADGAGVTECAPAATGAGAIGEACSELFECGGGVDGRCIDETVGWKQGYCSLNCVTDTECGAGNHCGYQDPNVPDDVGVCLKNCTPGDDTCRADGYACRNADQDPAGITECGPSGTGSGAVGSPCPSGLFQCAGGADALCLQQDWQDGYCSLRCSANADCGVGSHCGYLDPNDPTQTGVCLSNCTPGGNTCRADGYACYNNDRDLGGVNECAPSATGSGAVGAACEGRYECAGGPSGFCVQNDGWKDGYCSINCTSNIDCSAGNHCAFRADPSDPTSPGACVKNCTSDASCRADGYLCLNADNDPNGVKECGPGAVGFKQVGESCLGTYECAGGATGRCLAVNFKGGYCSLTCLSDTECGAGTHCAYLDAMNPTQPGVCLLDCTPGDMTCRADGYACYNDDDDAAGVTECAPSGTGTGQLGSPCQGTYECAGTTSATCASGAQYPDGYCLTLGCTSDAECASGGVCIQNICLDGCASDAECRQAEGYVCTQFMGASGGICYLQMP